MIINKNNALYYQWGNHCDAWVLLQSTHIILKEESMPQNTEEVLHYHMELEQIFYILEGQATFHLDDEILIINQQETIKVASQKKHKICNKTTEILRFLVISLPGKLDDRILVTG